MSLKKKIFEDLKTAMKEGNVVKRDTLRMLDSMIKNSEIEKKKREEGLSEEEILEVISTAIKQRKDASDQYQKAGRAELEEKENKEIAILLEYMPPQLSEEEIRQETRQIFAQMGISKKEQMGQAMGAIMARLKGKADGKIVKKIVEEELK